MANEPEQPVSPPAPTLLEIEGEDLLPDFLRRPKAADDSAAADSGGAAESAPPVAADGTISAEVASEPEPDDEPEPPVRVAKRVPPKNAQDLLCQEVPLRAESAGEKLRALLPGLILISFEDSQKFYSFTWKGAQAVVEGPLELQAAQGLAADCKIVLSERNLMSIFQGDLNPQVAMLTAKVRVSGNASLAIYFFNLVAPRQSL